MGPREKRRFHEDWPQGLGDSVPAQCAAAVLMTFALAPYGACMGPRRELPGPGMQPRCQWLCASSPWRVHGA